MSNNPNEKELEKSPENEETETQNRQEQEEEEEEAVLAPPPPSPPVPPPPPPPPPSPQRTIFEIGGSSSDGSRKRKGKGDDRSTSSSRGGAAGGGQRARRRRAVDAGVPATCAVCNRSFPSFYSLFGHLRSHNKRDWGGAFPPPVFKPDWGNRATAGSGSKKQNQNQNQNQKSIAETQQVMEQQVIPTLLDVAQETLAKLKEQEVGFSRDSNRELLGLDLNVEPEEEECQEKIETNHTGFDLNLPPKQDEEDDEDNDAPNNPSPSQKNL